MPTKQEAFEIILKELKSTSREITSVAVVSPDGMVIAGQFNDARRQMDSAAAMAALIMSLSAKVTHVLEAGSMDEIILRGQNDFVLVFAIRNQATLIVQARNQATLGQLLLRAHQALPKLSALF